MRWWFKLATGVTLWLVGGLPAWLWNALAQGGYGASPPAKAAAIVTIVLWGSGLWIVVGACIARPRE